MRTLLTRFIYDKQFEPFMFRAGLALYLAIIIIGSIPGARHDIGEVASGLVLHFVAYSCIAFLLACGASGDITTKAVKAFYMVAAMGALDEGIQSLLPYRNGAVTDWMVDITAALFTTLMFRIAVSGKSTVSS